MAERGGVTAVRLSDPKARHPKIDTVGPFHFW